MNACGEWRERLMDCALGESQSADLAAHLAVCPACAAALAEWRRKAADLDSALTHFNGEPRAGGPDRVLRRIAEDWRPFPFIRIGAATLALAASAILAVLPAPHRNAAALSTWRSPTDSLLHSPVEPLLHEVPRLGQEIPQLSPKGETHDQ